MTEVCLLPQALVSQVQRFDKNMFIKRPIRRIEQQIQTREHASTPTSPTVHYVTRSHRASFVRVIICSREPHSLVNAGNEKVEPVPRKGRTRNGRIGKTGGRVGLLRPTGGRGDIRCLGGPLPTSSLCFRWSEPPRETEFTLTARPHLWSNATRIGDVGAARLGGVRGPYDEFDSLLSNI